MTTAHLICSKCNSTLEEGFIADRTNGGIVVSDWVKDKPEKSLWTGTKVDGKQRINISTYRCINCGFLESYAR